MPPLAQATALRMRTPLPFSCTPTVAPFVRGSAQRGERPLEYIDSLTASRDTGRAMSRENVDVYRGHERVRRLESFQIKLDDARDCGDRALFLGCFEGQGRNGLEVRRPSASVWSFRAGRAVAVQVYADQAEALEAVGLRE